MKNLNKLKKIRLLCLTFIAAAVIGLTGCSDDKEEKSGQDDKVSQEDDISYDTQAPQEDETDYNPLKFTGFTSYEPDSNIAMTIAASVECGSMLGDKFVVDSSILAMDEKGITMTYILYDGSDINDEYTYGTENYPYETHLVYINAENMSVDRDITIARDYVEVSCDNGNIWYSDYESEDGEIICYDSSLNNERRFSIDSEGFLGKITKDGSKYYYALESKVYAYNIATKDTTEIKADKEFRVTSLYEVYTDEAGNDYLFVYGTAEDCKEYTAVIDVTNEVFVYIGMLNNGYIVVKNNTVMNYTYGEESSYTYTVAGRGEIYDFVFDNFMTEILPLADGKICVYNADGNVLNIALYDSATGELAARCRCEIPLLENDSSDEYEDYDGYDGEYGYNSIYINGTPVTLDNGKIFLNIRDYNSNNYYYIWDTQILDKNTAYEDMVSVSEHVLPENMIADIDAKLDFTKYYPAECDEKLQPLRQKADDMEKKYDIEIHIAQECANIIGGYAMDALTDYDTIEESLNVLDYEMAKYPDNFFAQFICNEVNGLDIYITGTIRNAVFEGGNLDFAGGFQNEYDGRMIMAIDCSLPESLRTTFHHELCHSIEDLINYKSYNESYFMNGKWDELNPYDDIYTYDYSEFGTEETFVYTYDYQLYGGESEVYFIDEYSLTFPTEDRARIFEYVMMDDSWIEIDKLPHIKEKLNYFAWCIRQVFDTTGWENVRWEKYME